MFLDFHWLHSTSTSTDFSAMKSYGSDAKQQNMGTIELCEDSDSSNDDIIIIREEKPPSNSTSNKGLLPVAKVQPYEPPLNIEEEPELDDDIIDLDSIMLDNNDQNELVSAMTESDPFMGIEPVDNNSISSTNNIVEDDNNKQELPSRPAPPSAAGPGLGLLRLRSFAVDPTNNSFNINAESNTSSNDSSTNASWHVTDEVCPPDPISTPNDAEVSIYEVPTSSSNSMSRPAFPAPSVTYHHLPTTTVQASLATMPQPIRQPIILRRALNQQPQQQLQMFQSPNGQIFGVAPTNQQRQTRFIPGQQITIRFPNNQTSVASNSAPSNVQSFYTRGELHRGFSSANVQVQQQQPSMAPASSVSSNIRTFTAPANAGKILNSCCNFTKFLIF